MRATYWISLFLKPHAICSQQLAYIILKLSALCCNGGIELHFGSLCHDVFIVLQWGHYAAMLRGHWERTF